MSGELFVVSTPIGNLEDFTHRGTRILAEASFVLAEDTRRTRTLLTHFGLNTRLYPLHAHSDESVLDRCIQELLGGAKVALVSDAGTPLVSDPGTELVQKAIAHGIRVTPIPGASAPLALLVAAGLPCSSFRFFGFLPRKGPERVELLREISQAPYLSIFFEAGNRTQATLQELQSFASPERALCVGRELTKMHETFYRGSISEVLQQLPEEILGEVSIAVSARERTEAVDSLSLLRAWIEERGALIGELSIRDLADEASARFRIPRKEAYRLILEARDSDSSET